MELTQPLLPEASAWQDTAETLVPDAAEVTLGLRAAADFVASMAQPVESPDAATVPARSAADAAADAVLPVALPEGAGPAAQPLPGMDADVVLRSSAASRVPAAAAAWFFVDDNGVLHYASERLDARYQRFSMQPLQEGDGPLQVDLSTLAAEAPAAAVPSSRAVRRYVPTSRGYVLYGKHIYAAARQHGVDADLLKAIATAESGFNASAVSPKGAIGLMQVIPATAARFGVAADKRGSIAQKLKDPAINVPVSARYVRYLQGMFPGRPDLVLAAYNAGEGAVKRHGNKIPPYKETQNYVKTVMSLYQGMQPSAVAQGERGNARVGISPTGNGRLRATIASPAGKAGP